MKAGDGAAMTWSLIDRGTTMNFFKVLILSSLLVLLAACSKVTEENYQQVENGMTVDQVAKIIGKPDVTESTNLAGISTSRSEWHGKKGVISIRYIGEKVRAKNWQPTEE